MTGGGGDSDLHRNGRKKKIRRTPESLREIPICIGNGRNGKKMKMTGDGNGIRGRGNAEIVAAKMSGAGGLLFFGGCVV